MHLFVLQSTGAIILRTPVLDFQVQFSIIQDFHFGSRFVTSWIAVLCPRFAPECPQMRCRGGPVLFLGGAPNPRILVTIPSGTVGNRHSLGQGATYSLPRAPDRSREVRHARNAHLAVERPARR